ncbi:MAG: class I SAM-dependent methyltransferase [Anaerolineae bacterium]
MAVIPGRARVRRIIKHYRDDAELYGKPCLSLTYPGWAIHDRIEWGALGTYIARSRRVPGWTRGEEAVALAQASLAAPPDAVVVEIGSFLGRSAVLLAGARKVRGSGRVYCVDPFDASGDAFSASVYRDIQDSLKSPLRRQFEANIRRAGLADWVEVCQGRADEVADAWQRPIDLLFMDGDQSFKGARTAYELWAPFLKPGGVLAVHNSRPGDYHADHDGQARLAADTICPPQYTDVYCVRTTTFARKVAPYGQL